MTVVSMHRVLLGPQLLSKARHRQRIMPVLRLIVSIYVVMVTTSRGLSSRLSCALSRA